LAVRSDRYRQSIPTGTVPFGLLARFNALYKERIVSACGFNRPE
jgi:hypothetical protein